jgi:hypothetical protein
VELLGPGASQWDVGPEGFWQRTDAAVGAGGALLAGFTNSTAARLEHEQRQRAVVTDVLCRLVQVAVDLSARGS